MITKSVTYGDLYRLLARLGFIEVTGDCPWKAYRHGATDTVVMLANRKPDLAARPADLASLRRHIVDNGILDQPEFERLLS